MEDERLGWSQVKKEQGSVFQMRNGAAGARQPHCRKKADHPPAFFKRETRGFKYAGSEMS